MVRRFAAVSLAVASAAGFGAMHPAPAQAETTQETRLAQGIRPCASYNYCFYRDTSYGGCSCSTEPLRSGTSIIRPYHADGLRDQLSSIS